jgi:hypothetical protein
VNLEFANESCHNEVCFHMWLHESLCAVRRSNLFAKMNEIKSSLSHAMNPQEFLTPPPELQPLLRDFTKEVLNKRPKNLVQFAKEFVCVQSASRFLLPYPRHDLIPYFQIFCSIGLLTRVRFRWFVIFCRPNAISLNNFAFQNLPLLKSKI